MRHGLLSLVLLGLAAVVGPGYGDSVHDVVVRVASGSDAAPTADRCTEPDDCATTWCDCAEGPAAYRGCSFGVCDTRTCDELCGLLGGPGEPDRDAR